MNKLKFIKQTGFSNRRIEFTVNYKGIKAGTVVDGTSVPKRVIFFIALMLSYLAYIGTLPTGWVVALPVLTFLVILPESNGLFFMAGARHDVKYQTATTFIVEKVLADVAFLVDMVQLSNNTGCSVYTRVSGVIRALAFFLGVFAGGWFAYWKYVLKNRTIL